MLSNNFCFFKLFIDQTESELTSDDVIHEEKPETAELSPDTELNQEIGSINEAILDDDKIEETTNVDTVKENDVIDNKDDLTEKLVSESSLESSQNPAQHNNQSEENDICQELKISTG